LPCRRPCIRGGTGLTWCLPAFFAISAFVTNRIVHAPNADGSDNKVPDAAIWAIHKQWLILCRERLLEQIFHDRGLDETFRCKGSPKPEQESALRVFEEAYRRKFEVQRGVMLLTPDTLNARIMAQQGLFLVPLDVEVCFMENLNAMLGLVPPPDECQGIPVVKLRLPYTFHAELMERLTLMNVTGFSLFPDLEGLSVWVRSLPTVKKPREGAASSAAVKSFAAILDSNLQARVSIPNRVGALQSILAVFSKWGVNIEYSFLVKTTDRVHAWSFDGTMSLAREEFRQRLQAALKRYTERGLQKKIERCINGPHRKLSGYKTESREQYLADARAVHRALLSVTFNAENWQELCSDYPPELLYDLGRVMIREELKKRTCFTPCEDINCPNRGLICENPAFEAVRVIRRNKRQVLFRQCEAAP
jgi:hypothetical protein